MARSELRPFLDTNVLFSGLYSPIGAPSRLLQLHARGRLTIVVSRQVLEELIAAVKAKKPGILPLLHAYLSSTPPEVTPDPTPEEVRQAAAFVNPIDAPILAAALGSRADCLVTGNTCHFTPEVARRAKITIFAPAAYLQSVPGLE